MNISLDFDDTFTHDPETWLKFVSLFRAQGHKIYVVTMRYPHEGLPVIESLSDHVDQIFFTSRMNKSSFMYAQGVRIDVWIDDNPFFILNNASS